MSTNSTTREEEDSNQKPQKYLYRSASRPSPRTLNFTQKIGRGCCSIKLMNGSKCGSNERFHSESSSALSDDMVLSAVHLLLFAECTRRPKRRDEWS